MPFPFQTTPEQCANAVKIAQKMLEAGLSAGFVADVLDIAAISEGVCDLIEIWNEDPTEEDRQETVKFLRDCIKDHRRFTPKVKA
jgi:hypothetical protein